MRLIIGSFEKGGNPYNSGAITGGKIDWKVRERISLLSRCYWPAEKLFQMCRYLGLDLEKLLDLQPGSYISLEDERRVIMLIASRISDEKLVELLQKFKPECSFTFRGKYYTYRDGNLELRSSWGEVRQAVLSLLMEANPSTARRRYALLKALAELCEEREDAMWSSFYCPSWAEVIEKVRRILGEAHAQPSSDLPVLEAYGLYFKGGSNKYPKHCIPFEIIPAVKEALDEWEKRIPKLSTREAVREYIEEVVRMEGEFQGYLEDLLGNRLDETVKFGKIMSPSYLVEYLKDLFGSTIFLDHLLSITQQYSICDAEIINVEGSKALSTGFNLALFGEPGTGKTFATKDMILGNQSLGIPPHGLPGINRYCGGMTPARFIAIGEAYQDKRFNFIVPEFNDWFKYRGMVEPLKLAMERGVIRYETKSYTVGPYRFSSFLSVNYNTKVYERGYEVTINDPNFNAIEDRMLCRLHRLTKDRYQELARSQRDLMLGKLRNKMGVARKIRDHLTLVYAIQIKHPKVAGIFGEKKILLTEEMLRTIEDARNLILENLGSRAVPFSPRLEMRAIQLASAMSLMNYFNTDSDTIRIDSVAAKIATQFFVEETWIRSRESFPLKEVLKKLGIYLENPD